MLNRQCGRKRLRRLHKASLPSTWSGRTDIYSIYFNDVIKRKLQFPISFTREQFHSVLASFLHSVFTRKLLFMSFHERIFPLFKWSFRTQVPFYPNLKVSMVQNILTWIGWLNSALNPFIYAFYSEDFRAAFYRLTFRRFCVAEKKQYSYPINSVVSARR